MVLLNSSGFFLNPMASWLSSVNIDDTLTTMDAFDLSAKLNTLPKTVFGFILNPVVVSFLSICSIITVLPTPDDP